MERGRSDHRKGGSEPGKGVCRESRLEERRYHRVSDGVWMTLKRTLVLEEEEADNRSFLEDEDEVFHTPPSSPRNMPPGDDPRLHDPVLAGSNATQRHYTPVRAQRMLTLHDTIVRDITHPEATRLSAAVLDAARVEGRRRLVMSYFPGCDGHSSHTVKYLPPRHDGDGAADSRKGR